VAKIFFIFFAFLYVNICAQKKINDTPPRLSIYLQYNIIPIASQNTQTINCLQGQLGIDYKLFKNIQVGIFGQTILYHQNTDLANIDNKIIELSSIEYNTLGISTGYKTEINKFILYPKIDFGYSFFIAKSLDFPTDKTEFLDYRYLSITPKINFGYAITNGFTLGLNFGYNKQLLAFKGRIIDEFNPSSVNGGIFAIISIK
jgi:hypothetical protein